MILLTSAATSSIWRSETTPPGTSLCLLSGRAVHVRRLFASIGAAGGLMTTGTTYEYKCRGVRSGLTHHHGVAGELSVVLRDCRQLLHDVPRVRGWSRRGAIRRPAPRVRLGDQAAGVAHPDRRCPSGERPCRRVDLARRAHVRSHRSRERTEWQPKDDVKGVNLRQSPRLSFHAPSSTVRLLHPIPARLQRVCGHTPLELRTAHPDRELTPLRLGLRLRVQRSR